MNDSLPFHIEPDEVPLPPADADVLTTCCDYCVVACGYKVYRWPVGTEGGPKADQNAYGKNFPLPAAAAGWVSPNQHNVVTWKGRKHNVVVRPDVDSEVVNIGGDHSIRGGTIAKKCFNPKTPTKDRLQTPLLRVNGKLEPISWNDAIEIFGSVGTHVLEEHGAHAFGMKFMSYNFFENTYAITRLAWHSIGTPASAWHDSPAANPSTPGLGDAGFDPFAASYQDWYDADVLLISGTDPFETKTILFNEWILRASREHGQKQIYVNPRRTAGIAFAEANGGLWLDLLPGTDTILHMALARYIIEQGWEDSAWIKEWTNNKWETDSGFGQGTRNTPWQWRTTWGAFQTKGFEDYKAWVLSQDDARLDRAAELTGLDKAKIVRAAEMMAKPINGKAPKTSMALEKGNYWSNNYLNTASFASLALVCGIGNRDGRVLGRLGGHQRGGLKGGKYPLNRSPEKFAGRRRKHLDLDKWMTAGKVKLAYCIGTTWSAGMCGSQNLDNTFARLTTQSPHQLTSTNVKKAIETLKKRGDDGGMFLVDQDIYLRPIGEKYADLVLPASGWGENDFTRANGERRIRLYSKFYDAPGEAKADWWIVAQVAKKMGFDGYDWESTADIFEEGARFSRGGRLNFHPLVKKAKEKGVRAHEMLRSYGTRGLQAPLRLEDGELVETRRLHDPHRKVPDDGPEGVTVWTKKYRAFGTQTGKANFLKTPWKLFGDFYEWQRPKEGEYWVVNCRINEVWQSGFDDVERRPYLTQRWPDNFIEIHPDDAKELGIESGDQVVVESDRVPAQTGGFVGRDTEDLLFDKLMKDGHIELTSARVEAVAIVMEVPRRGVTAMYFLDPKNPANSLAPRVPDPISNNYRFKLGVGKIRKVGESPYKNTFAQMSFASRAII